MPLGKPTPLTVQALIERLSTCPPDAVVWVESYDSPTPAERVDVADQEYVANEQGEPVPRKEWLPVLGPPDAAGIQTFDTPITVVVIR